MATWRGSGLKSCEGKRRSVECGSGSDMQQCWIGSAHFTPGTTQSQHAAEVTDHLGGLPATTLPVLLGCDVNSVLSWGLDEHGDAVVAPNNGKTSEFVSLCHTRGLLPVASQPPDFQTPTSRPRQAGRAGKQIDAILASRTRTSSLRVLQGSHLALGTDHECLQCEVRVPTKQTSRPYCTRPRLWTDGPQAIQGELDQQRLVELAKSCTKPRPSNAYRDPEETKTAFAEARRTKTNEAWTHARRLRKQARKAWEAQRLRGRLQGIGACIENSRSAVITDGVQPSLKHRRDEIHMMLFTPISPPSIRLGMSFRRCPHGMDPCRNSRGMNSGLCSRRGSQVRLLRRMVPVTSCLWRSQHARRGRSTAPVLQPCLSHC